MTTDGLSGNRSGLSGTSLNKHKPDWWKVLIETAAFTPTAKAIVDAIDLKIGSSGYSIWRVGLTHDLVKRKSEWADQKENCNYWSCWEAASLSDAQAIERHFISKGMKGGTGGNLSSSKTTYVYVF